MNESINRQELVQIIEDLLFLSPRITGNSEELNLPGIRGFISACPDPRANRVGLTMRDNVDEIIRQTRDFFADQGKGFTWVSGPVDIQHGLSERLLAHGFVPAGFHQIAGMYLKAPYPVVQTDSAIRIREISVDAIECNIPMIAHSLGVNENIAVTINRISPHAEIRSRYYLAFLKDDEPIGFCASAYVPDQPILLLRGAGVVPKHRGKGVYTSMIQRRLSDAYDDGLKTTIVQSARSTSYRSCQRFGFHEICAIEWYQWSPVHCANP